VKGDEARGELRKSIEKVNMEKDLKCMYRNAIRSTLLCKINTLQFLNEKKRPL
jgi:hypothetical protein